MKLVDLTKITLIIYKNALVTSFKQTLLNWKIVGLHLGLLVVLGLSSFLIPSGNIVFGFIRGFVVTYLLSIYFASVRNIINREKTIFKDLFSEAWQIFSPLISILFALMIVNFLLRSLNAPFLTIAFGILFSVLANPLPEVIYLRGGMFMQMIENSFEFVLENFIEWFLPIFIVIGLLFSASPTVILQTFGENPLQMFESIILLLSIISMNIGNWGILIPALYLLLFIVLFRGNLFLALQKGRRARLYMAKQS